MSSDDAAREGFGLSGVGIRSAAEARLFLGSRWRCWHPHHALTLPSPRAVSRQASGRIAAGAGHGAVATGGFAPSRAARGIPKLGAAAAACVVAGVGTPGHTTTGIAVGGAGMVGFGAMGRRRTSSGIPPERLEDSRSRDRNGGA